MEEVNLLSLNKVLLSMQSTKIISQMGLCNVINIINLYFKVFIKMESQMVGIDYTQMKQGNCILLIVKIKYNLYILLKKVIYVKQIKDQN